MLVKCMQRGSIYQPGWFKPKYTKEREERSFEVIAALDKQIPKNTFSHLPLVIIYCGMQIFLSQISTAIPNTTEMNGFLFLVDQSLDRDIQKFKESHLSPESTSPLLCVILVSRCQKVFTGTTFYLRISSYKKNVNSVYCQ